MGSITVPFGASGPRSPTKRPRGLPPAVTNALTAMVWDVDCEDFIAAARQCNLKPDTLRRWLLRPEAVSFVLQQRAARRLAICARNETVLADIRDNSENQMARVGATKVLEQLDEQGSTRGRSADLPTPGVTIRIVNIAPQPIDVTPKPVQIDASE